MTIKVEVTCCGYLDADHKNFEMETAKTEVDTADSYLSVSKAYLKDIFSELLDEAIRKYKESEYDYKGVHDES